MSSAVKIKLFLVAAGLGAAAVYAFAYSFRAWRRNRVVEDTPTSRVRSAAQGYLELTGRGEPLPKSANRGPLTGIPCTWWRYTVEERSSGGRSRSWSAVDSGTSEEPFLLDDGTGRCLIDPRGAEVFPATTNVWYGPTAWPQGRIPDGDGFFGRLADRLLTDRYRYTEHRLGPSETVYGIGAFRSLGSVDAPDPEQAAATLLREWKRDQAQLLRRFDANHDGVLSSAEWEVVRSTARAQILDQLAATPTVPRLHTLSKPTDGRPFLLAAQDQRSLAVRFRRKAFAGMAICLGSSAAAAWILVHV